MLESTVRVDNSSSKMTTKELGFLAENIAARHLREKGYEIIAQNYQKPWGEIDIIARSPEAVAFVEVKANRREFGMGFNPEVRVDQRKLSKITKTAMLFLEYELGNLEQEWQVDIISITFNSERRTATLRHFKNVTEALF